MAFLGAETALGCVGGRRAGNPPPAEAPAAKQAGFLREEFPAIFGPRVFPGCGSLVDDSRHVHFDNINADRVRHSLVRRLEPLGHVVTLQPAVLSA